VVRLAILIPVLARPQNVAPLVASLQAVTTTEHRIVWLCSPGDDEEIAACRETDGEVMVMSWEPGRADFAKKINYAFTHTSEPWLFQGADDLRFSAGWDAHALLTADRTSCGVVGTNDLGNPLVKRGVHSTHTFFSRSYIETHGGTVDGSGIVFSEAYSHEYCDNEFVDTAKARGQFVSCKRSVVEHLHPHWGKSEMDSTYEKATANTLKDRQLYSQRIRNVRTPQMRRKRQQDKRDARIAARRARQ
jgi:hypothetical protein